MEFLSLLSPQDLLVKLKDTLEESKIKFSIEGETRIVIEGDGVNVSTQIVRISDNGEGSYLLVEKVRPNREKFEKFYFGHLQKILSNLFT